MLNKEICKQCMLTQPGIAEHILPWTVADDEKWERGIIRCPCSEQDALRDEEAPFWCAFRIEQMMSKPC